MRYVGLVVNIEIIIIIIAGMPLTGA